MKKFLPFILILVLVGAGAALYLYSRGGNTEDGVGYSEVAIEPELPEDLLEEEAMMVDSAGSEDTKGGMSEGEDGSAKMYTGTLVAGSLDKTPYIEFNRADYEKAISKGKKVYLEFYAAWCPTCRSQEKALIEGFNELGDIDLVAFRVNYKDDDTDAVERALEEEFGVTYQHHKAIVKGEDVLFSKNEIWTKAKMIEVLTNL